MFWSREQGLSLVSCRMSREVPAVFQGSYQPGSLLDQSPNRFLVLRFQQQLHELLADDGLVLGIVAVGIGKLNSRSNRRTVSAFCAASNNVSRSTSALSRRCSSSSSRQSCSTNSG